MINRKPSRYKCTKCGWVFEIPIGNDIICFSEYLHDFIDKLPESKNVFEQWIQDTLMHEYERGLHNAKCENQLHEEGPDELEFEEVELVDNTWISGGKVFREISGVSEMDKEIEDLGDVYRKHNKGFNVGFDVFKDIKELIQRKIDNYQAKVDNPDKYFGKARSRIKIKLLEKLGGSLLGE
jgi:hypothetical protein